MNKSNLNSSIIALGAFSACVAVAAGAFAAHGLKDVLNTEYLNTFRTAADYQLAHSVGSDVSRAYNRAIYLDERKELMQWWSDYLNKVKQ